MESLAGSPLGLTSPQYMRLEPLQTLLLGVESPTLVVPGALAVQAVQAAQAGMVHFHHHRVGMVPLRHHHPQAVLCLLLSFMVLSFLVLSLMVLSGYGWRW